MQNEKVLNLFLKQAAANIISYIAFGLYPLVATIFIGRYLGSRGLAATAGISTLESLLCQNVPIALSVGALSMIGPALGQKDVERANSVLSQFFVLEMIFSVAVPVLLLPFNRDIVVGLGSRGESVPLSVQFMYGNFGAGPLLYCLNGGLLPLIRQENRSRLAMFVQLASSVICIIMNAILFPLCYKQLEMYCPSISVMVALAITGAIVVMLFTDLSKHSLLRIKFKQMKLLAKDVGVILVQAIPQLLNVIPLSIGFILLNI